MAELQEWPEWVIQRREGKRVSLDLLTVKLTCEELEEKHGLTTAGGFRQPSPAFLAELAERLGAMGVEGCSSSLAWQVWLGAIEQIDALKKSMSGTPS